MLSLFSLDHTAFSPSPVPATVSDDESSFFVLFPHDRGLLDIRQLLRQDGSLGPDFTHFLNSTLPSDPTPLIGAFIDMDVTLRDWVKLWSLYRKDEVAMEKIAIGGLSRKDHLDLRVSRL